MADKYISLKALFKAVEDYASARPVMSDNELFALFCSIPSADVQPVRHGRWMLIEYPYGQKTYVCSECKDDDWWNGRYAYGDEHYCPNCGAKMDTEEQEAVYDPDKFFGRK